MPGPLRELGFSLLARVKPLPTTLDPVGSREDSHRGGVVWDKTADIVVSETTVGVWSASPQDTGPVLHTVTVEV